ncbi:MAG TPA: alpha/beta fold hydrolase [Gammaproteobacteria bacterium]|nr:alpha/beta fold hydrolase [Gammaproteobacteria bacterium]
MKETVVLLHGLWMKSVVMQPLATRLRQAGFTTRCFSYPSVQTSPSGNAGLLHDFLLPLQTERLHFVAHSLGGIVLLHYFQQFNEVRPGRVVMLGTPVAGSAHARKISQLPFSELSLGKSIEQGLLGGVPAWTGGRDLGMIAGTRGFGFGNLMGRSEGINDGAVYLDETRIPGLTDHISLAVSHSAMLLSRKVADQTIHFLKNGYFSVTP